MTWVDIIVQLMLKNIDREGSSRKARKWGVRLWVRGCSAVVLEVGDNIPLLSPSLFAVERSRSVEEKLGDN